MLNGPPVNRNTRPDQQARPLAGQVKNTGS
jgi:hypothetical protein